MCQMILVKNVWGLRNEHRKIVTRFYPYKKDDYTFQALYPRNNINCLLTFKCGSFFQMKIYIISILFFDCLILFKVKVRNHSSQNRYFLSKLFGYHKVYLWQVIRMPDHVRYIYININKQLYAYFFLTGPITLTQTYGSRAFSTASPVVWNQLPDQLRYMYTVKGFEQL